MAVVFPAPLGPSNAKKSPCFTLKLMAFSALTPLLYSLDKSIIDNAFINLHFAPLEK